MSQPLAGFACGSPEKAASSPAPPAAGHKRVPVILGPPSRTVGGNTLGVAAGFELVTAPASEKHCVVQGAVATGGQRPEPRMHQLGISTAGPEPMVRAADFGEGESERTAATGGRARTSKWTGVRLEPASGKWQAAIGLEKGRSYSTPLGSWDTEIDAADAYAAAAAVLRKDWGPPRGHMIKLKLEDRAIIEHMTHADGTALLKARAWHNWCSWHRELYPSAVLAETTVGLPLPSSAEHAAADGVAAAADVRGVDVADDMPRDDVVAAEAVLCFCRGPMFGLS
ncbi:unnamed protein product [Closterium sp. Naga37s-1]|nr:unnamed protein product [Closterium sp. Naga37s-1]